MVFADSFKVRISDKSKKTKVDCSTFGALMNILGLFYVFTDYLIWRIKSFCIFSRTTRMADRLTDVKNVVEYEKFSVKNRMFPPKAIINKMIRFILVNRTISSTSNKRTWLPSALVKNK